MISTQLISTQRSFISLKRHMAEYRPQLENANSPRESQRHRGDPNARNGYPNSEEFSQALADLHVTATVLKPYSEGMVESIAQLTEDRPD